MKPGEYLIDDGEIVINANRDPIDLIVTNTGDRPVQVGSHYHFSETNGALDFDRDKAVGRRLDIPAGTAVRLLLARSMGHDTIARPRHLLSIISMTNVA